MLPKLDKPLFELRVPSVAKNLLFRPFTVKEEKILLTAQQSGEEKDILLAIKQVINNCCQEEKFNIDDLATFDLEYLFLKLRSKSVSNVIEVSYRDNDDNKVYDFEIDLERVEMLQATEQSNVIPVTDSVGIKMKYPSAAILNDVPTDVDPSVVADYLIQKCIDCIYDSDSVYTQSDYTTEELAKWVDELDMDTYVKIQQFFDNIPKLYYKIEYTNSKGDKREIELTTLSDFFTWQ